MDRSTTIGLVSGFSLIVLAIVIEGGIGSFLSLGALFIVLGGVLSAAMVNFPIEDLIKAIDAVKVTFRGQQFEPAERIEMFTMFARRARRNGLLVLDQDVRFISDVYTKRGLELAIDGIKEDDLVSILEDEIESTNRRHQIGIRIMDALATYSPAFGMIGTLIGLILMLQNLQDAEGVGKGLAVALITTFYGAILANLVFTPLAGKLEEYSTKEINEKEMIKTGIISLANGENPRIMEKKMLTYTTPDQRAEYQRMYGERGYSAQQEEKMYNHWLNQQKEKWEKVVTPVQNG